MPQAALARNQLTQRTAGVPRILEVRYRHAVEPGDHFVMEPGYVNFQPIKRGQLLARDGRGESGRAKAAVSSCRCIRARAPTDSSWCVR